MPLSVLILQLEFRIPVGYITHRSDEHLVCFRRLLEFGISDLALQSTA
jgi:hypothetical protein